MAAETFAASREWPFPWDIARDLEFGLIAATTGIPILSKPVILAILVIPSIGKRCEIFSKVFSGSSDLYVPDVKIF